MVGVDDGEAAGTYVCLGRSCSCGVVLGGGEEPGARWLHFGFPVGEFSEGLVRP
jgi:hypothetical protein